MVMAIAAVGCGSKSGAKNPKTAADYREYLVGAWHIETNHKKEHPVGQLILFSKEVMAITMDFEYTASGQYSIDNNGLLAAYLSHSGGPGLLYLTAKWRVKAVGANVMGLVGGFDPMLPEKHFKLVRLK